MTDFNPEDAELYLNPLQLAKLAIEDLLDLVKDDGPHLDPGCEED